MMNYLTLLLVVMLSACANVDTKQDVEVFMAITFEEKEEGFGEQTGYKKVNAITTIEKSNHHLETDLKTIEDYYDLEGNYLKTTILHSQYNKSYVIHAKEGDDVRKKFKSLQPFLYQLIRMENID
ncbi:hypothetical protein [Bacillus pinisoli]|uniref:hypothetical protein n=1 Tax=Bacillus pinisoli TaxID=2901866 RepID=UPI001FF2F828|nr:hypothetical protein [Bacillus pinisoli]